MNWQTNVNGSRILNSWRNGPGHKCCAVDISNPLRWPLTKFLSFIDVAGSHPSRRALRRAGLTHVCHRSVTPVVLTTCRFAHRPGCGVAVHPHADEHSGETIAITQGDWPSRCPRSPRTAGPGRSAEGHDDGGRCHSRISRHGELPARSAVTLRDEVIACGVAVRTAAVLIDMTQAPSRRQLI